MEYFYFYREVDALRQKDNEKILPIPKNITDELFIFNLYEKMLNMPGNYGKNWDAFFDNLKCLSFVTERNVIVVHEDVPFQNKSESRRIYIEILFDSVRHWWEFPEHKFYVFFPESYRGEVISIIDSCGYD